MQRDQIAKMNIYHRERLLAVLQRQALERNRPCSCERKVWVKVSTKKFGTRWIDLNAKGTCPRHGYKVKPRAVALLSVQSMRRMVVV